MSHAIQTSLAEDAAQILAHGHFDKYRLAQLVNTPTNCPKHPLRYTAVIITIGNKQFQAVGNSPVQAIANALGQEMISRQGWSHGG